MSAQPQRLVAALDLGSTKVVAAHRRGDRRCAGRRAPGSWASASSAAAGIRRGVVRDIEETTRAIDKAMKSAQRMAGVEVGSVYCGIAGEHVAGRSSHGMVVGHRRRDPHQRRRPGQRHGEQHQLRAGPRAAARHSAGLSDRPAGRDQRADRDDGLAAGGRGLPGHGALERAAEPEEVRRAGRLPRRGVRAGAAGGVARGAHAGRDRAGLRHRRAGGRVHQRVDLPQREDPAHRLAALRRRTRDRRHRARTAGDPARRGAAEGALRRRLRAAGAGERRVRAAQHAGPGRAQRAASGAGAHHAHAAPGSTGVRARRDHPRRLSSALTRGRDPHGRRGADPGHRGAGPRGLRDAGPLRRSGPAARGVWRTASNHREWRYRPAWCSTGPGRWR